MCGGIFLINDKEYRSKSREEYLKISQPILCVGDGYRPRPITSVGARLNGVVGQVIINWRWF